ncbi:hypothetical protein [Dongia deserti]|uniref:hypothetical protein n=1 Tax=Dongia deserti TaxID=2268030 RepID=UPI0013C43874|nr:hypothetical protein [Dongia deserti]
MLLNISLFIAGGALGGAVTWWATKAHLLKRLDAQIPELCSSSEAVHRTCVEQSTKIRGAAVEIKPKDPKTVWQDEWDDYDTYDWAV